MSRLRNALFPVLLLGLCGCSLLTSLFGTDTQDQAVNNEARQAELEMQRRVELDAAKLRGSSLGASDADVLAYAQATSAAHLAGLEPVLTPEEHAALEASLRERIAAATDEARLSLQLAEGELLAVSGRPDLSAERYLEGMQTAPATQLFEGLAALPSSPTSDAALLESCPLVRPLLDAGMVITLVELCLARAGGDTSQLTWPEAQADLAAAADARARREEAERIEAEAQAAAEAQTQAARERVLASTFASGSCRFSKCETDGWDTNTSFGTLESRCRFSSCLENGWDTRLPSGGTAETRCRFSKCASEGWDTRLPDGSTLEVRCRFSKCFEDGWTLNWRGGDGDQGESRCRFSKCFEDGWDMQTSAGVDLACRCRFSKCLEDGTECG